MKLSIEALLNDELGKFNCTRSTQGDGTRSVRVEETKEQVRNNMTTEQLREILGSHKLWLDTDGVQGCRAEFVSADLDKTSFHGADLSLALIPVEYSVLLGGILC